MVNVQDEQYNPPDPTEKGIYHTASKQQQFVLHMETTEQPTMVKLVLAVWIGKFAVYALLLYVAVTSLLAASVAVLQETKIWRPKGLPSLSLWGKLKVFFFNIVWFELCLAGSLVVVAKWALTLGASDMEKDASRLVEDFVARIVFKAFVGDVHITGLENLPAESIVPAPVYIANHASQIDTGVVYFLGRRFKWIAKKSVLFLPGVGSIMSLGKHVFIDRKKGKNGKSVSNLFEKSNATVQAGLPMFLFPQGTRCIAERLPAKEGAFIIAQTNKSPLILVSIDIPETAWNSLYPLNRLWGGDKPVVKITVHPVVNVTGVEDRETLKETCMNQIYSVLPTYESNKDK